MDLFQVDTEDGFRDFKERAIFVDETGFNLNIHRKKARSMRGTRVAVNTKGNRGKNISVFGTLSAKFGFMAKHRFGSYNAVHFSQTLSEFISLLPYNEIHEQGLIFILDNAPFHHSRIVKDTIENAGHHCLFLPPYSPFLNPIENAFSKLKSGVIERITANRERDLLVQAIGLSSAEISIRDCRHYFRHTFTYLRRCENREKITSC